MSQADLLAPVATDNAKARRAMIDSQLRPNDINDKHLLKAVEAVERSDYLPEERRAVAYRDRAIPLGDGRFAMAPTPLFKLMDRAMVVEGEDVLVVGPHADYAARVLAELGAHATALDGEDFIGPKSSAIDTVKGDITKGHGGDDSYDLILFMGAVEEVSDALVKSLRKDGRIAAPIIDNGLARLAIGRKVGAQVSFRTFADAQVHRLGAFDQPTGFSF